MMSALYVGIDVSKETLDVAVWQSGAGDYLGQYANDNDGYVNMLADIKAVVGNCTCQVHLILEPTGGYEVAVALFAFEQEWLVSKVNPMHVRRWADGTGRRAKTDRQDALLLAEFGAKTEPPAQEPMDENVRQLDNLLRRRDDLDKLIRAEKNRLKQSQQIADMPKAVLCSIERTLQSLQDESSAIDRAIQTLFKCNPRLREQRRLLLSVPGVGFKSVLRLLVIFHRFLALTSGQGSSKQLVAFLGLDPTIHTSGRTVYKRPTISRKGDGQARATLYMASLGGIRGHNVLSIFYQRMLQRGKAKKVALVACSRKILTWAWAVFISDSPFDSSKFPHLVESAS